MSYRSVAQPFLNIEGEADFRPIATGGTACGGHSKFCREEQKTGVEPADLQKHWPGYQRCTRSEP
eukprot:6176306-Pleurochrysis_carterae.AAC.4